MNVLRIEGWLLAGALASALHAQTVSWSWPGCPDVTDSNFTYTTLVQRGQAPDPNIYGPVKMALFQNDSGTVDIYYVEKGDLTAGPGRVKLYHPGNPATVKILLTLPTFQKDFASGAHSDLGLTGIVLDPNFRTNHYLYLHWSPDSVSQFRLSRFTVTGDTILRSSEKILLAFPDQRQNCCHAGGGMQFDDYGDLWIGQGDDVNTGTDVPPTEDINDADSTETCAWEASCSTHGFRGSVLRIHPDSSAKGYSIPTGNFGEYFAQQTGNPEYLDTSKVLPEIYLKGTRNAYSVQLDPVRRWLFWGDVGPDLTYSGTHDEEDMRKAPGFMGWPYFIGHNIPYSHPPGVTIDSNGPVVNSKWNTGLDTLPRAIGSLLPVSGITTITGPFYRYDGDLQSAVKFPPHFQRHWFFGDYSSNQMSVVTLDSNATTVLSVQPIFTNNTFYGPVDIQEGPDGAFYVINYAGYYTATNNTGILKISYNGTCHPATPKLEQPSLSVYLNPAAHYVNQLNGWMVNLGANGSVEVPQGMIGFELFDLLGRKVWSIRGLHGGQSFAIPASLPHGALKYHWVSASA